MSVLLDHVGSFLALWMPIFTTSVPGMLVKRAVISNEARTSPYSNSICSNLFTTYLTPTYLCCGKGDKGGQERLTGHACTADTTSGMALLPVEAKLLVGKILEVNSSTLSFKVIVKKTH